MIPTLEWSWIQRLRCQLHVTNSASVRAWVWLQSGGPNYPVELGRYDGRLSTKNSVVLPHANFNLDQLNAYFSGLGFTQTEMIALSGETHHRRFQLVIQLAYFSCTLFAIYVAMPA